MEIKIKVVDQENNVSEIKVFVSDIPKIIDKGKDKEYFVFIENNRKNKLLNHDEISEITKYKFVHFVGGKLYKNINSKNVTTHLKNIKDVEEKVNSEKGGLFLVQNEPPEENMLTNKSILFENIKNDKTKKGTKPVYNSLMKKTLNTIRGNGKINPDGYYQREKPLLVRIPDGQNKNPFMHDDRVYTYILIEPDGKVLEQNYLIFKKTLTRQEQKTVGLMLTIIFNGYNKINEVIVDKFNELSKIKGWQCKHCKQKFKDYADKVFHESSRH
jgi:hypothetical protein